MMVLRNSQLPIILIAVTASFFLPWKVVNGAAKYMTYAELDELFQKAGAEKFKGHFFICKLNVTPFVPEFEMHYFGKPVAYVTTKSVGKSSFDLVDPYRESALYHEYLLVGPGYAKSRLREESSQGAGEVIRLVIYDEAGLHTWAFEPNLPQHNMAKEHVWALINGTGMLPSLTLSNTTFLETFKFFAEDGDRIAYHLYYPNLFRTREPTPPMDVLLEFPANTKTLRTLKTIIDYQTFALLRWRLSQSPLVLIPSLSNSAPRSIAIMFHDKCDVYVRQHFLKDLDDDYFHSRFMKCVYHRRVKVVENPCIKDMFVAALILDYPKGLDESASQLLIAVPMVHDLHGLGEHLGWMNLTDVYCPPDLNPEECGEPQDLVLTNDHLVILTDKGLWVSVQLDSTNENVSLPYPLKPLLRFSPIDPCVYVPAFNCSFVGAPILAHHTFRRHRVFYTPVCHLYQLSDPLYEDILIYVLDHVTISPDFAEERDAFTVLYAAAPYIEWRILFVGMYEYETSEGVLPIKELVTIFFNHHRRQFDISVVLDHENGAESTIRFVLPEPGLYFEGYQALSGLLGRGFLEFTFPQSFVMTHHQINTETMDVFFLGNEAWIAEAAGAFVYVSIPAVYDHNGNASFLERCSFNHPDRIFVCSELTHNEIYLGRVGVSYAPIAVEYDKLTDFKFTALYRNWPSFYLYYVGLTGHFFASYSGKVVLWFMPNYNVLFAAFREFREDHSARNPYGTWQHRRLDCTPVTSHESPVRCLHCNRIKPYLDNPGCVIHRIIEGRYWQSYEAFLNIEFPINFEMLAFDPVDIQTKDVATHGPLVPFPIDGDKAVIFEAEVPPLAKYIPGRHYLNDINVGNRIVCDGRPAENASILTNTTCNEGRKNHGCELYIRHTKKLKRNDNFAFLHGFRRAFYVTIVKPFNGTPVPTDVIIIIGRGSNNATIQLGVDMFDLGLKEQYTFDFSHVGATLYLPEHFSVLLVGFPKFDDYDAVNAKNKSVCSTKSRLPSANKYPRNFSRMVGYATRYYRLGTRIVVPPFKSYIIKFPTYEFCDWYQRSIKDTSFTGCQRSGDIVATEYEERREVLNQRRKKYFDKHMELISSINQKMADDLNDFNLRLKSSTSKFFQDLPNEIREPETYQQLEDDVLLALEHPTIGEFANFKLKLNRTYNRTLMDPGKFKCKANPWSVVDGGCHLQLVLDNNPVIKQSGGRISLDKHDSLSFTMKLRALSPLGKSLVHQPLMVITNSNPDVLLVERSEKIGADPQVLRVTLTPTGVKKGVASVTVRPIIVSTYCPFAEGSFTLIVQVHRAKGRRLHVNYPVPVCKPKEGSGMYPRPWKVDLPSCVSRKELLAEKDVRRPKSIIYGDIFYSMLPVNYRPPSYIGADLPTSKYVYNVDPQKPRMNDWFRVSKDSGELNKCRDKATLKDCLCSPNERLSEDVSFTDCKRMVYTVKRGLRVDISVEYDRIMRDKDQHVEFFSPKRNWTVYLEEVNKRREYAVFSTSNLYVQTVHNNFELRQDPSRDYHDSQTLSVTPHGTGLFHFKVTLGSFDTFDEVTGYFMLYVPKDDFNHVEMMLVMLLTITVCMAFVFIGFLVVRKRLAGQLPFQVQERTKIKAE